MKGPTTPKATTLLGTGALVLTAVLGWLLVVGPQVSARADAELAVEDARTQNAVLAQQLSALEKQAQQLPEAERSAERLGRLFPPTADLPGLFRAVTAAAEDAGIGAKGVTTLAPTAPVQAGLDPATGLPPTDGSAAGPQLARQTVSVSVTGSYEQTRQLLDNLEQMDRAYLIGSVTLAVGEGSDTFLTAISGEMFVMPQLVAPDVADAATPIAGRS